MASRALSILSRVNAVLNKFSPADRKVFKRVITASGGDPLIGRPATVTYVDSLITPQPTYQRLARYDVGPGSRSEMAESGNTKDPLNQYAFLCTPTALAKSDLDASNVQLLLVDSQGNKEVFEITDYDEPAAMGGVDIIYVVFARSVSRP